MLRELILFFLKAASFVTSNRLGQQALSCAVQVLQAMMGIGTGSRTGSGEVASVRLCASNATIFDVGANVGQFAKLVQSTIKPGRLICFEPGRQTFSKLKENVRDAELINIALGAKPDVLNLYYDEPGSGMASLTKRELAHFGLEFSMSEQVEVDTIDRVCVRLGVDRIDLLKIDVEGHELEVLQGAASMLERRAIRLVQFEFGGSNIDTRTYLRDFFYFFSRLNMMLYRITPSGHLHRITGYREIHEQFRTTNFLAINHDQRHHTSV